MIYDCLGECQALLTMDGEVSFTQSLDRLKESFLWAAAQGGSIRDCESLIEIGADINWKGPQGDSPLLAACRRGHTETVAYLLAHGADANAKGEDSLTAAHIIAKRGDAATLNVLLQANVDVSIRATNGQTCLDIAKAKGFQEIFVRLHHAAEGQKHGTMLPIGRHQSSSRPIVGVTGGSGASAGPTSRARGNLPALAVHPQSSAQVTLSSASSSSIQADESSAPYSAVSGRSKGGPGSIQPASVPASFSMAGDSVGRSFRPAQLPPSSRSVVDNFTVRAKDEEIHLPGRLGEFVEPLSASAPVSSSVLSILHSESGATSSSSGNAFNVTSTDLQLKQHTEALNEPSVLSDSASTSEHVSSASLSSSRDSKQAVSLAHEKAGGGVIGTAKNSTAHFAALLEYDAKFQALRGRLDQEQKEKRTIESKLSLLKDQNNYLATELTNLRHELSVMTMERNEVKEKMQLYLGDPRAVSRTLVSIEDCDELERELKTTLEIVEARKALLTRERLDKEKEQRLCVVCQEAEKSVVLLPCRHLCLCDTCSLHDQLSYCPLCRRPIAHKISVYA